MIRPDAFSVPAVHGVWEEWSPWSLCSFTCGRGHRTRTRMCAPPQHGGRACDGPETQTKLCNIALCPGIIHLLAIQHNNNSKNSIVIYSEGQMISFNCFLRLALPIHAGILNIAHHTTKISKKLHSGFVVCFRIIVLREWCSLGKPVESLL